MKKELQLDFIFNKVPTNLLWNSISTPSGLEEWFADEVKQEGDVFSFRWEGNEDVDSATLKQSRVGVYVRFHWNFDEDPKSYFEMRIGVDELTRDVILKVTEIVDEEEMQDAIELWELQVEGLKNKYAV